MKSLWQYSTLHQSVCKVIKEQTLWGGGCRTRTGGTRAPFRLSAVECDVQPAIEVGRIAYALLFC